MNWRNMTVGKKNGIGFGIVLMLLILLAFLSFRGVGGIVGNASQVIQGNRLDGELAQKEVDHLNWVAKVNALLADENITTLDVQTDDHKCGFGKFLYGEGRENAEKMLPSLAPGFKDIEEPHRKLHESAIDIGKHFKPADQELPALLADRITDHLRWTITVRDAMNGRKGNLGVQTDPTQCALGKWMISQQARDAYEKSGAEYQRNWNALVDSHAKLHATAVDINKHMAYGKFDKANKVLDDNIAKLDLKNETIKSILSDGMEKILDPQKQRAARSGNIQAYNKWSEIDETMNESVVQAFLLAQIEIYKVRMDSEKSKIQSARKSIANLHEGLKNWTSLLTGTPMENIGRAIEQEIKELDIIVDDFFIAISEMGDAEKEIKTAETIFSKETMPILKVTLGYMANLKKESENNLSGMQEANRIYASDTIPSLKQVQGLLKALRQEAKKHVMTDSAMLESAQGTRRNVTLVSIFAIIMGVFLAFMISRGIVAVLRSISNRMNDGAEQVASASDQVSQASQSLAEGASEQAASIEETSSSLEEMSSMTRQNAENANQANDLMKDANDVVGKANSSMSELTKSMSDISSASQETSKIIKTIDEIAFQTNLLALNAAVEAARAGEAGAGFAVVADEVRNLALRAADAAKNTSDLIEGTVKKIDEGSNLVNTTNEAFSEVAAATSKVGELVSEISAASSEQAEGIEQLNKAIVEMDKVTQQNAASAEESASASEEMNAQALSMKDNVRHLVVLVGGDGRGAAGSVAGLPAGRVLPPEKVRQTPELSREVSPEKVIPMDDDFQDF